MRPDRDLAAAAFRRFQLRRGKQTLYRQGAPVDVHSAQMLLLHALGSSPNRAVSRENLLARSPARAAATTTRSTAAWTCRFCVCEIVENDPAKPRFIKTVWGIGYMLVAGVDA